MGHTLLCTLNARGPLDFTRRTVHRCAFWEQQAGVSFAAANDIFPDAMQARGIYATPSATRRVGLRHLFFQRSLETCLVSAVNRDSSQTLFMAQIPARHSSWSGAGAILLRSAEPCGPSCRLYASTRGTATRVRAGGRRRANKVSCRREELLGSKRAG